MKITVKSSGEVYYTDHWETRIVSIDEEEIKGTIDWDAFRREAAKDILAGFAAKIGHPMSNYPESSCKYAIQLADELIKQLKEDEK